MIGYCLRTSAAASRPSSTSCCGVYLFFGSLIAVCAIRPVADRHETTISAAAPATAISWPWLPLLRILGVQGHFSARGSGPWRGGPGSASGRVLECAPASRHAAAMTVCGRGAIGLQLTADSVARMVGARSRRRAPDCSRRREKSSKPGRNPYPAWGVSRTFTASTSSRSIDLPGAWRAAGKKREDLTSEAFLALHRNLDSIDQSLLPGWRGTVVRNRARDGWRRGRIWGGPPS